MDVVGVGNQGHVAGSLRSTRTDIAACSRSRRPTIEIGSSRTSLDDSLTLRRRVDREAFLSRLAAAGGGWDQLVNRIPRQRMTEPGLGGGWSVKDVVAHVTWSERKMIAVLRQRALVGSPLWERDQDARNAIVYVENRDRGLDDVLDEELRVYAELLPLLEELTSEDLVDAERWERMLPAVPPWRIFAGSTFLHYEDHADAIRRLVAELRLAPGVDGTTSRAPVTRGEVTSWKVTRLEVTTSTTAGMLAASACSRAGRS